jgi:hypothetical protein
MNVSFVGENIDKFSFDLKNLDIFVALGVNIEGITISNSCFFNISNVNSVIIDKINLTKV